MSDQSKTKRPGAIVMISIYTGLMALLGFIEGVPLFIAGQVAGQASAVGQSATLTTVFGLFLMLYGIFEAATVYGLWSLQEWGLKFAKILYFLAFPIIVFLLTAFDSSTGGVITGVIEGVLAIVILFYLYKPETKALFEQDSE